MHMILLIHPEVLRGWCLPLLCCSKTIVGLTLLVGGYEEDTLADEVIALG